MKEFAERLLDEMHRELSQLALNTTHELQRTEQSFQIAESAMQQLKAFMKDYEFQSIQEEILFFKEIKPQFQREMIYYCELMYIDANKPVGSRKCMIKYYHQVMEQVQAFFGRNHLLYTYYRMGRSDQDELLYVRETDCVPLIPDYSLDFDSSFTTINSSKLGKIMAFERVCEYLTQTIQALEYGVPVIPEQKSKHLWTESKAALIELAYALHSRGAVNNGKCDVKAIINSLEQLFNVEVGNFYRTFQSMRIRKKNRTSFLDNLKLSLEKRMDETDLEF